MEMNTESYSDPVSVSEKIELIVTRGEERKYYRFRDTKFYGGIATADCVGCNLNCLYCWSDRPRRKPKETGKFYSPKEISNKIIDIAREHDYSQVRISGNEPTIGKKHLISVIKKIRNADLGFVLETNGILIGANQEYANSLANFKNLHVRVSLKGYSESQFSKLTGMDSAGFKLQLKALKNLLNTGCKCHPVIMKDFGDKRMTSNLLKRLRGINPVLVERLELEKLKLYPHVRSRLKENNLLDYNG